MQLHRTAGIALNARPNSYPSPSLPEIPTGKMRPTPSAARLFTIVPAPWFKRHRNNPQLKAFVDGATAAATGAITGAVIVLGARAITDLPTAAIALISLGVLWRFKISEPILVTISGLVGLILWPLVRAG